jgi:hypothetical protein
MSIALYTVLISACSYLAFFFIKNFKFVNAPLCRAACKPGRHGCENDLVQPDSAPLLPRHFPGMIFFVFFISLFGGEMFNLGIIFPSFVAFAA